MYERFNESLGHLDYEKHPGDAEGDDGALDEGEDPHLNKFHEDCHQFVRWAKSLREYERAALKIKKNIIKYIAENIKKIISIKLK